MLCPRCHQREARMTPEQRARFEERSGVAWPWPDVCAECLAEVMSDPSKQDPELRARVAAFEKAMNAKLVADLRAGALKVLDLADRVAKRF